MDLEGHSLHAVSQCSKLLRWKSKISVTITGEKYVFNVQIARRCVGEHKLKIRYMKEFSILP